MQKAIVTGGAGFIGSNLVDKLINMGVEVHIMVLSKISNTVCKFFILCTK